MKRKGITPVVATVLLMGISVAAAASAYNFMIKTQNTVTGNYEERLNQKQRERKTDMNIETMYKGADGNFTYFILRNTGSISLELLEDDGSKILSLYVNGIPVSSDAGTGGKGWKFVNSPKNILDPQETVQLNTTETYPAETGQKTFKIVGQYGISDSHICYNSGSDSC